MAEYIERETLLQVLEELEAGMIRRIYGRRDMLGGLLAHLDGLKTSQPLMWLRCGTGSGLRTDITIFLVYVRVVERKRNI